MAVSPETLNLLAQIIGSIQVPSASPQADMAKTILLSSQVDFDAGNYKSSRDKGGGGPSVVSRIFDLLSRPNYAVASASAPILEQLSQRDFKGAIGEMRPWKTIPREWAGLSGQNKETFTHLLAGEDSTLLPESIPRPVRAGLGLTLDIGLDPTTYIGPGLVKGAYKGTKGALGLGKATEGLQDASRTQSLAQATSRTATADQVDLTLDVQGAVNRATNPSPVGNTAIPSIMDTGVTYARPAPPNLSPLGRSMWDYINNKGQLVGDTAGGPALGSVKWSDKARIGAMKADVAGKYRGASSGTRATRFGAPRFDNLPEPEDVKLVGKGGKAPSRSQRYGAEFSKNMRVAREQANIGRSPAFYGQVQRAEQLVNRIGDNSAQAAARTAPKPPVEKVRILPQEETLARLVSRQTMSSAKVGRDKALNPKQQLVLFKNLLGKATGSPTERMHRAIGMLRSSQKYLESQGYAFKYWDGTGVKLTDVFDEIGDVSKIGPDLLRELENGRVVHPGLDQAIEAARARSAMDDAGIVKLALDQSTSALARTAELSGPRAESVTRNLSQQLNIGLHGARVSPAARSTAQGLFRQILNSSSTPMQRAMSSTQSVAHDIMNRKASVASKVSREEKINKAIESHMGSRYREVAEQLGSRNQAVEFLGMRFQAHYGYSALRPMAQDHLLSAQVRASARSRVHRDLVRSTTPQLRRDALMTAQRYSELGRMPAVAPEVAAVAERFRSSIENLFSSTGIRDTAASVATRAAFTMEDMNAELRRVGSEFQFVTKATDDLTQEVKDYSKGVDWLKSWETAKLGEKEDAVEFISKLEVAAEKVAARYGLLDEAAARYSTTQRQGPFRFLAADPRLAGRYFTKEAVVQVNRMNSALKNAYNPKNDFMKFVDRVTSAWKSGVTIYAPSHHIRNLIGDVWLSWIAGVNNPKYYRVAGQVLRDNRHAYEGAINVERLVGQNAMGEAMARPGRIVIRNKDGFGLTSEQFYIAAHRRGLLLNAKSLEDIYAEPLMPKVLGGRVQRFASGAAELREHYVRLAHFANEVGKSKGSDLKSILDNAAHNVRKWHPDGMDLTDFERKYLRRIFPFYSWQRKAFPLVLESMVMKPGKIVAYPKTMEALQASMGIEGVERTDPFPEDQLFPKWIREKGIGPIGATGMGGIPGGIAALSRQGADKQTGRPIGGYSIVNPSNPMVDLVSQFGGSGSPREPLQALGSSLHPAARIPIELTTDQQLYTGIPVSYDYGRYTAEQIPGAAMLSRISNVGAAGPTERGQREGIYNNESMLNYLFAAGLLGTGPYIEQGRREQQGRTAAQRKKAREEFLRGGY